MQSLPVSCDASLLGQNIFLRIQFSKTPASVLSLIRETKFHTHVKEQAKCRLHPALVLRPSYLPEEVGVNKKSVQNDIAISRKFLL